MSSWRCRERIRTAARHRKRRVNATSSRHSQEAVAAVVNSDCRVLLIQKSFDEKVLYSFFDLSERIHRSINAFIVNEIFRSFMHLSDGIEAVFSISNSTSMHVFV